jgi:pantetheine-phosphate adenylyltransferase
MNKKYETVVVGGTFDLFHKGHTALLFKAFEIGKHVIIGLTSDEFVKKLIKPHGISNYVSRLEYLKKFLKSNNFLRFATILPLNDPYGITLYEKKIEAIIVSEETQPRAKEINNKRIDLGMPPLEIITINMVPSADNYPISSTRIWFEEIDREGNLL